MDCGDLSPAGMRMESVRTGRKPKQTTLSTRRGVRWRRGTERSVPVFACLCVIEIVEDLRR